MQVHIEKLVFLCRAAPRCASFGPWTAVERSIWLLTGWVTLLLRRSGMRQAERVPSWRHTSFQGGLSNAGRLLGDPQNVVMVRIQMRFRNSFFARRR